MAPKLWGVVLLTGLLAASGAAQSLEAPLLQPQGLSQAGIYALRELAPDLTGAGVRFGIICRSITYKDGEPQNDYQPNVEHPCLQNAKLRSYDTGTVAAGVSPHSTAICSILFGEDPDGTTSYLGPFQYQGVAPAAEGHVYEFWHFLERYVFTLNKPAVDVLAASIGSQFEDWWTRGIESLAEHEGLVVVAGIGNGSDASDPPLYPGAGSNVIGVGVVSSVNTGDPAVNLTHFALAQPERSSLGPTDDGRCKPDVIAPGNCLVAGTDDERSYLKSGDWSSFATPVAAGVVGLLVQTARQNKEFDAVLSPNGGNCLLKAIVMNSATKLPYWHKGRLSTEDDHDVPLDYIQGAGMVDALGAHQILTAGRAVPGEVPATGWDLNEVDAARTLQQAYRFVVDEPADRVIAATLAWNRHYRTLYPFDRIADRDSDLRFELWAIDPADSSNDLLLDYSDSKVDNVEHIYIRTLPGYTVYELVVSYNESATPVTPEASERYGVAWSVSDNPNDDSIFWHDLNADGIVNELDFAVLMNNWVAGQKSPEAYVIGDVNADGSIDAADLEVLFAHRNRQADWHVGSVTN